MDQTDDRKLVKLKRIKLTQTAQKAKINTCSNAFTCMILKDVQLNEIKLFRQQKPPKGGGGGAGCFHDDILCMLGEA